MKAVLVLFEEHGLHRKAPSCYRVVKELQDAGFSCDLWIFCRGNTLPPDIALFEAERVVCLQGMAQAINGHRQALAMLEVLCEEYKPEILLFAEDYTGTELSPCLAYRIGGECLVACTGMRWDSSEQILYVEKAVYGGNVFAEFAVREFPFAATLKTGEGIPYHPESAFDGEMVEHRLPLAAPLPDLEVLGSTPAPADGLEEARVVFAAGRGFGGRGELQRLHQMLAKLGVQAAATRPLIQSGMMPMDSLVGITGKSVFPDLLITAGISGSAPFMSGARYAKKIIAVNNDPDALIFTQADVGVLADCKDVLRELELLLKLREL